MADDPVVEALKRIDTKLAALLAIVVDGHLRDTEMAKPRPRTIDKMLVDVGLTQVEVARLLGKTPQAVGQVLQKDKKGTGKPQAAGGGDS
ncbi:hypothetical protein [Kribbella jiaozuonensis]|uniref:Uncharacterized protein n=1 Tax=Kribbella jiaozuonensis TaxID=2575441 RepID=A0A4U3LYW6_9ACTN|nr:hypothetical protein [Kribbella jiaozuonensis]TKK80126.1 hypothetical protein FDA38_17475 [Kribbella jiaozuonensis]